MFEEVLEYSLPEFDDKIQRMVDKGSRASLSYREKNVLLALCYLHYDNQMYTLETYSFATSRNISKALKGLVRKRYVKVENDFLEIDEIVVRKFRNIRIFCFNNNGKIINNYV